MRWSLPSSKALRRTLDRKSATSLRRSTISFELVAEEDLPGDHRNTIGCCGSAVGFDGRAVIEWLVAAGAFAPCFWRALRRLMPLAASRHTFGQA